MNSSGEVRQNLVQSKIIWALWLRTKRGKGLYSYIIFKRHSLIKNLRTVW